MKTTNRNAVSDALYTVHTSIPRYRHVGDFLPEVRKAAAGLGITLGAHDEWRVAEDALSWSEAHYACKGVAHVCRCAELRDAGVI